MKSSMFSLFLLFIFLQPAYNQSLPWTVKNQVLQDDWSLQSSSQVKADGRQISEPKFSAKGWYGTQVPGSTLGSLVDAGVFRDIFFDRNLEKIPAALFDVPWWYRRTFMIDKVVPGQVYRLRFNGISYRADIWLNGKKIASADTIKGSFRQFTLDVSKDIKEGLNTLALEVSRAKAGELNIGFVDWNPEPADNNMGIWRDVHLLASGPVVIRQPFIITTVDTATLDNASVALKIELRNLSGEPVTGRLHADIGKDIHISKAIDLAAGEARKVMLDKEDFPELEINHPRLWWTHDLGNPYLYTAKIRFDASGQMSDRKEIKFGIRSITGYFTPDGFRAYRLNGKKILIKGGGWTDPMLLNATADYETAGIDYAVHMNLNALRMEGFWGHNQHIFDLCDEKGILIMAGFNCQWEWKNLFGLDYEDKYGCIVTPEQMDVAVASWHDQLVWLRNHPSIFLWLYGSDKWPRPALEQRFLDVLQNVDPTRPYAQSAKEWVSEVTGPTGMKMRGPYDYVPPNYWYVDKKLGGAFGFNTETGPGPQIPVLKSLMKMIPKDSLWPISDSWLYHAARGKFHNFTAYNRAMRKRLGDALNLEDYLRKAQFLNYEGMRAMFEAFEANRFNATGIIQWMYNASWPKLWWQLYDFYLMPTGGFYGARDANEPLHIYYNYGEKSVGVMNNTSAGSDALLATIRIYDAQMNKKLEKSLPIKELKAQEVRNIFSLPVNQDLTRTWFLDLRLSDKQHKNVSTNFYVLSTRDDLLDEKKSTWYITPQSHYADLTMLQQMPKVKLIHSETISADGDRTVVNVKLRNPTPHLAFMVYLDLQTAGKTESVVPVFWEQNYITLLPGDERTVSVWCHTKDLGGQDPRVLISGWNVDRDADQAAFNSVN